MLEDTEFRRVQPLPGQENSLCYNEEISNQNVENTKRRTTVYNFRC
jgi:hypothetical protein